MLTVRLFDVVRLKDGREGAVVEIYQEPLGYEVEIVDPEMDLVTVSREEIDRVHLVTRG